MKKVLIATTALVGTAGMAAAEISFSGNARFGLTYNEDQEDAAGRDAEFEIEQRLRFQVTGTATTDNGLEFEARFRAEAGEDVDNSISGGGFGAAGFAVSTGGLRLDVGNVSDVTDSGDVFNFYANEVGFTAFLGQYSNGFAFGDDTDGGDSLAYSQIGGFGSGDASQTTIKLRYNFGDFTVSGSYSDNEDASSVGNFNDFEEFQIGVGYTFGNYSIGVAYINLDGDITSGGVSASVDDDIVIAVFNGEIGAANFSLMAADGDENDDIIFGGSLSYDIGAATAIQIAASTGGDSDNDTSYGIGFSHSLGGGVTLGGGIGSNANDQIVGDLGVSFNF